MPMIPQNAMHMPLNSHSPLPEGGMPDLKAMGMGHYGADMGMQGQMQRVSCCLHNSRADVDCTKFGVAKLSRA